MKKGKRIVSLSLGLIMVLSIFTVMPFGASAASTSGNYVYEIHDGNTIEITGYKGSASNLTLPSTLDGFTVKSIGVDAFLGCTTIESVTIPSSITSIGGAAFAGCSNMRSIKLPNSVVSIGAGAFNYCSSLETITIPNKVKTIEGLTFYYCSNLKSVKISSSVKTIEKYAFMYCNNLGNVTIPQSVTKIGEGAFYDCISCKKITILNPKIQLDTYAIGYCYSGNSSYPVTAQNISICSFKGSSAEEYARANDIPFAALSTSISVNTKASLYVKGKTKITPKVVYPYGQTTYKSSNTSVAKVDANGVVTGVKKGTAKITVANNGTKKIVTVTVKNPTLNATSKTLKVKKSFTLKVTGKIGTAKFTSSNKKVATVSSSGKVTAKKKGTATISVKTNGVTLKCKVKVK
ncbi:MAG: leucine-rich repeat protein [Ruminococcus sp.]